MKWNAEAQRIDIFPGDSPEDIFRRIASAFHLSPSQIDDYIGDPVVIDLISFFSTKIKNESAALELLRNGNNNLELEIGKLNLKVKELQTERDSFQTRYIENLNSTQEMMNQHSKTAEENNALKAEKKILLDQNRKLTERLNRMLEQNFGVKSEKTDQLKDEVLHGEEWKDPLSEDAAEEENKEQDSGKTGTLKYKLQKPRKPKRKGKRKEDLSKLPVQTVYEYDIDKYDSEYGKYNWRFAGWNVHETAVLLRRTTYVKRVYTPVISHGLEHELTTEYYEGAVFQKSYASSSLLSGIICDKFLLFATLCRLEKDETRYGFPISRQTMSNWITKSAQYFFKPVYDFLKKLLSGYSCQQCDETTWRVIRDGRQSISRSYFWIHTSSQLQKEGPPIVLYQLELTRSGKHLDEFFEQLIREGVQKIYLVCDAYSAYESLERRYPSIFIICGCFSHSRRRFVYALEVLKQHKLNEEQLVQTAEWIALEKIRKIFNEEARLKDLSADERKEERQKHVKPLVDDFFDYLKTLDPNDPLYSEHMKDAISYSLNQEVHLRRFLEDGNIPCHNNYAEISVKAVALSRKNSLFSNTFSGGESTGIILTMIQTALANQADPYYYIKYLLEKMPKKYYSNRCQEGIEDMVPWSEEYRNYEKREKQLEFQRIAPAGNEKPRTPRKKDKALPVSSAAASSLPA